jgi:alpha-beta hydrolase superfamily lysophospholipase
MTETVFNIPYRKGQSFFACEWSPDGEPKGMIVLIHGLSDHASRYRHVGSFFSASGYTMIIVDLRGHGRSFGKRGHFPSFQRVMDDISLFLEVARRRFPALPLVLYGHSMGGNLVLNYLIRTMPNVAGAVVSSPWLRLNFKPPLYKAILATVVNRVFPSMTQPDGIIPSFLSHDEEVGRKYIADPLVHNLISVRTFLEISRAGEYALKHADRVSCPLLLMHGTEDPLTSFSASKEFSQNVIVKHTFKAWDGLLHELHNEFEKETILGFVKEWIDSVILVQVSPG